MTQWIEQSLYSKIKEVVPLACIDLLIVHNYKLLVMLRKNDPAKGEWFVPGGRILKGETFDEAVYRIIHKETKLSLLKYEFKGVIPHFWPSLHTITLFYKVKVSSEIIQMNSEHSKYKWVDPKSEDLHPYIKEMIKKGL